MKDFNFTLNLKVNEEFVKALEHLAQVIGSLPVQGAVAPAVVPTQAQAQAQAPQPTPQPTPQTAPAPQPESAPVQPAPAPTPTPAPQPAPAADPVYTIDDLARKAQGIMDSGKLKELTELLAKYSVSMLPQLPQEQYAAFYKDMEGLA